VYTPKIFIPVWVEKVGSYAQKPPLPEGGTPAAVEDHDLDSIVHIVNLLTKDIVMHVYSFDHEKYNYNARVLVHAGASRFFHHFIEASEGIPADMERVDPTQDIFTSTRRRGVAFDFRDTDGTELTAAELDRVKVAARLFGAAGEAIPVVRDTQMTAYDDANYYNSICVVPLHLGIFPDETVDPVSNQLRVMNGGDVGAIVTMTRRSRFGGEQGGITRSLNIGAIYDWRQQEMGQIREGDYIEIYVVRGKAAVVNQQTVLDTKDIAMLLAMRNFGDGESNGIFLPAHRLIGPDFMYGDDVNVINRFYSHFSTTIDLYLLGSDTQPAASTNEEFGQGWRLSFMDAITWLYELYDMEEAAGFYDISTDHYMPSWVTHWSGSESDKMKFGACVNLIEQLHQITWADHGLVHIDHPDMVLCILNTNSNSGDFFYRLSIFDKYNRLIEKRTGMQRTRVVSQEPLVLDGVDLVGGYAILEYIIGQGVAYTRATSANSDTETRPVERY